MKKITELTAELAAPSYSPCKMQPSCFKQWFFDKLRRTSNRKSFFLLLQILMSSYARVPRPSFSACSRQVRQSVLGWAAWNRSPQSQS